MSILSSLYHGEIHNRPNDVHNVPQTAGTGGGAAPDAAPPASGKNGWMGVSLADDTAMDAQLADVHAVALSDTFEHTGAAPRRTQKSTDGSAALPRHAERRIKALKDGDLRPPLYYTAQEQTPCANGVWESAHTVASKLESKEEFPQG